MYRRDYGRSGCAKLYLINGCAVSGLKPIWEFKRNFTQGHEARLL